MAEIYNEMLIRNVDCGVLYFQIKDDEVIKEYEELKKEKAVIENGDSPDDKRLAEVQKRIEELSKEIFSMKKKINLSDKNNRFYYSGTIADSLMGRKLRQVAKDREEYDKVIRTVGDSDYTDLIINLKFKQDIMIPDDSPVKVYDPETKSIVETDRKKMKRLISKKKLRKMAYKDGVTINGVHYVNYQRTSSKARVGNCLFIDERYYDVMNEWQNLGIPFSELKEADIVSIRSYQSLIASSIIGELEIPVDSILLIDDISGQATMDCNVVKPFPTENGRGTELKVVREPYTQKTDLWDGQSLLDFSVFKNGKYAVKDKDGNKTEHSYEPYGFMLLRNHFFKTAAFNTNLQEYYKERFKGVENPVLKDMFGNEFKTEDVKMVTTPNSVKIFKFADIVCEYMIDEDKKKHLRELQAPLIEKHEELRKAKQAVATAKRKLTMLLNYDPEKGKEPPTEDDIETSQYSISEAEKKYDEICMSYDDETKQILKDIKLEQQRLTWDWFRKKIKDEKFGVCNTGTKENKQKYLPMIYDDICLLEVLSNISIDSAKRTYDTNIETEIKKIRSRPYLKTENAIIEGDTIVFTETRYKKSLSEKKIKEYERLVEKRNNATTEKELEEINAEINDVLMVSKDYMIHPYFTKNLLKSQPKKKKRKKYENEEQKELHHQKQKAYVQEQKALREVIYRKMESPMDILSQIIREKIVRSPRTIYLPCFVDVLKPIPSGMKADYNRINAIKELCLEANSKINCVRGKYREGSLSYDEMYEEINTIEKDVINNIKEREITPFDINVLIRKVYDKRPKRDPHHGKIIRDEKGKYIYVDKRDQDIIKAKAGGLLLRYVYAAHKDDFLKAIKESGKGTVSYVQKYEPKKHTVNKVSSLKDVGKLMEQDNEIFSLDGVEYEIVKRKAE